MVREEIIAEVKQMCEGSLPGEEERIFFIQPPYQRSTLCRNRRLNHLDLSLVLVSTTALVTHTDSQCRLNNTLNAKSIHEHSFRGVSGLRNKEII